MNPFDRSLADWLRIAERRRHESMRAGLGLPAPLRIGGLQLEALAYHLTERSGSVAVKLEDDVLRVGEPNKRGGGIPYRGDAIDVILSAWRVTREEATGGIILEVQNGVRI